MAIQRLISHATGAPATQLCLGLAMAPAARTFGHYLADTPVPR